MHAGPCPWLGIVVLATTIWTTRQGAGVVRGPVAVGTLAEHAPEEIRATHVQRIVAVLMLAGVNGGVFAGIEQDDHCELAWGAEGLVGLPVCARRKMRSVRSPT